MDLSYKAILTVSRQNGEREITITFWDGFDSFEIEVGGAKPLIAHESATYMPVLH
jgi:hypothetical protein